MALGVLFYAFVAGLAVFLYVGLLSEARWLGATDRGYAVILLTLVVGVSAPYFAMTYDAPLPVVALLVVLPMLTMAASLHWVVRHTGGIVPKAELFYIFARINRIGQGRQEGSSKRPGDDQKIIADLAALTRIRDQETSRLIDALIRINQAWVKGAHVSASEAEAWHLELWKAADELWGPGWRRRAR